MQYSNTHTYMHTERCTIHALLQQKGGEGGAQELGKKKKIYIDVVSA